MTADIRAHILELIDHRRLSESMTQLKPWAAMVGDWTLNNDIELWERTYHYLLAYAARGTEDPERGRLYAGLVCRAYELTEQTAFLLKCKEPYNRPLQQAAGRTWRTCAELEPLLMMAREDELAADFPDLLPQASQPGTDAGTYAEAADELFCKWWASRLWTAREEQEALHLLRTPGVESHALAVAVCALLLNLMEYYDDRKLNFLLTVYAEHADPKVGQRALVAVVLCVLRWERRLPLYEDTYRRLQGLEQWKRQVSDELFNVQLNLWLARETVKVDRRLRDEILPTIQQSTQQLGTLSALTPEGLDNLDELERNNPEWHRRLRSLREGMDQLFQLQQEGADMFMNSFEKVKNLSFFQHAAHWFYPFDTRMPDVQKAFASAPPEMPRMLDNIPMAGVLCDSDKYSFVFCMATLMGSAAGKGLMAGIQPPSGLAGPAVDTKLIGRHFVQDLYRFCKLWPYRSYIPDVFMGPLSLWQAAPLSSVFSHRQLLQLADFLFHKQYMEEAAGIFRQVAASLSAAENTVQFWQQYGMAEQSLGHYEEAVALYRKAELMDPDGVWTLKQTGGCYARMGKTDEALAYYNKVKDLQPDDPNTLFHISQLLITAEDFKGALKHLFKLEYMGKKRLNVFRAIGWCCLMERRTEQAAEYLQRVVDSGQAGVSDFLNLGHARWVRGEVPSALDSYAQALAGCASHTVFMELLDHDCDILCRHCSMDRDLYVMIGDMLLQRG